MTRTIGQLVADLRTAGFVPVRVGGREHTIFKHPNGAMVALPTRHPKKDAGGLMFAVRKAIRSAQ